MNPLDLRPSPIAGKWYPGHPATLRAELDRYLAGVPTEIQAALSLRGRPVLALIVPHAGYLYSGQVAAHAFAWLRGLHPEIVAVISPFHYPHAAWVLTSAHAAYATPLGPVEIDRACVAQVAEFLRLRLGKELYPLAKDTEHALEIELPFLQHLLGKFRLLPIMMRDQTWKTAQGVGEALATVLRGKEVLLVASSDLSHFHPKNIAEKLDAEILRRIENLDAKGVIQASETGVGLACGQGAIAAVLWAARQLGADEGRVLCHATSGEVTGDFERVVGYGAAVVLKSNILE